MRHGDILLTAAEVKAALADKGFEVLASFADARIGVGSVLEARTRQGRLQVRCYGYERWATPLTVWACSVQVWNLQTEV